MSREELLNLNVLIGSWLSNIDDTGIILYTMRTGIKISQALEKLNINYREILTWDYTSDNNIMIITR